MITREGAQALAWFIFWAHCPMFHKAALAEVERQIDRVLTEIGPPPGWTP